MNQKTKEQLELEEYERDAARKVNKVATSSYAARDQLELIKSSVDLVNASHRPVLDALHTVTSVIPPLKLILTSLVGIWEIIHAVFLDKKSSVVTRGSRVALALGIIALGIAAIAAPPVAGALLVAAAGISIGKELLNLTTSVSSYLSARKVFNHETDPAKKKFLQQKLTHKRNKVIDQAFTVGLAVTSLVGFALLITPFFPIGLGILIGSAVAGVAVKLGPPLVRKAIEGIKYLNQKIRAKYFKTSEHEKEKLEPQESEREGREAYKDTTTRLSEKFASDDVKKEILEGIKEAKAKLSQQESNKVSKTKAQLPQEHNEFPAEEEGEDSGKKDVPR